MQFNKNIIKQYIEQSNTFEEFCNKIGKKDTKPNRRVFRQYCTDNDIDISKILPKPTRKPSVNTVDINNVLCVHNKRLNSDILRSAMIKYGFKYQCNFCGLKEEWQSKPIVIEIDHINGNNFDNRPDNLRFLCPNCHSQTPTFRNKNTKKKKTQKKTQSYNLCQECGLPILSSNICLECLNNSKTKVCISREELIKLTETKTLSEIAKIYHTSYKVILNKCKKFGIKECLIKKNQYCEKTKKCII